jgi:hypothetical protein
MYAVQFCSVDFKKSSKLNQTNAAGLEYWFGWCDLYYNISVPNNFKHKRKRNKITVPIKIVYPK